jgi:hypothetical protein
MKIISFIQDEPLVKKILNHLDLWQVKRKPPPRAYSPPAGAFIIYDQSSSPSADDYLIDADYPIEATFKNPAPGPAVSYGQIGLNSQLNTPKSMVTTKLTFVNGMDIDPI